MTKGSSYHHGDLRNALIMSAVEVIEERGDPEFSISEAARRAGVSAAAPYRHFRDREALLEAVTELCFIGLGEKAEQARAEMDPEPVRLPAGGGTFLSQLLQGAPLGLAFETAAAEAEGFDLSHMLTLLIGANAITDIGDTP